jgi:hypothetical protein
MERTPKLENWPGRSRKENLILKEAEMAITIQAVNAYRPRIEQGNTVQKPELLRAASRATGIVEGTLDQSIKELRDQIIEFTRAGRAVKVDGLGRFSPSIDLEGKFAISFRPCPAFANGLNVPGIFTARSSTGRNRQNKPGSRPEME